MDFCAIFHKPKKKNYKFLQNLMRKFRIRNFLPTPPLSNIFLSPKKINYNFFKMMVFFRNRAIFPPPLAASRQTMGLQKNRGMVEHPSLWNRNICPTGGVFCVCGCALVCPAVPIYAYSLLLYRHMAIYVEELSQPAHPCPIAEDRHWSV